MTTSPATSYKNLLQEHCQKMKIALPHYSVVSQAANRAPFLATVTVMGRDFTSKDGFSTKKQAEQNAAKVSLQNLNLLPFPEGNTNIESDIKAKELSPASNVEARRSLSAAVEGNSLTVQLTPCVAVSKLPPPSPVSFKNLLQEKAHKLGLGLPNYDTQACDGGFVSVVTINGQSFKSDGVYKVKKQSEQSAASAALTSLVSSPAASSQSTSLSAMPSCSTPRSVNTNMSPPVLNLTPHSITPEAHKTALEVSWKNLLQEHVQQCGMKLPVYNTAWQGTGFVCCLQIGRESLPPSLVCPNKKLAEQMAAKEGLVFLGLDPEKMAKFNGRIKLKRGWNQRGLHLPRPGERTSWIRPNWNRAPHFDSSWEEMDYFWEQSISKRRRVDTTAADQQMWDLPVFDSRPYMSVGEIWKEKKNIVVVGNAQASFVLYCTAVQDRCQLFCEGAQCLVTLEPGHRIIGLDAQYLEFKGKVTLQAARCVDILFPPSPDPVLTSCGLVLLYQDPESRSGIQVLLKRYIVSQAFINVLAALAQYFRRKVTGRAISLDMRSCVEHIHEWMLQEVRHIAAMDEASLRQMFSHMWKFNEKWCVVLKPSLPRDLQVLQAQATAELARRQASGVIHPEDFYRPWSLPKGNFKHRVLSTGFLIESPAECAVRELREETGIQLDTSEVQHLPFVDLPHMDNLNPHCGDIVRYYLYVYTSESLSDEEELNTTEDANSSVAWEAEASQGEGTSMTVDQASPCLNTQGSESATQNFDCTPAVNDCKFQLQDSDTHGNKQSSQTAKERLHEDQGKSEKAEDALEDDMTVLGPEDKEAKICESEEQRGCEEQGSGADAEISQVAETSCADSEKSKDESSKVQGSEVDAEMSQVAETSCADSEKSKNESSKVQGSEVDAEMSQVAETSEESKDESSKVQESEVDAEMSQVAETSCADSEESKDESSKVQGSEVDAEMSQVAETSCADSEQSKDESCKVQGAVCTESKTGASQERRGLKRKRDSNSESDHTSGNSLVEQAHLCQTPSSRQPSERTDNTVTPTKSPHVHGGVHEECAWLPLNEATQKSPVFGQIYSTTPFIQLLASMEVQQ